MLQYFSMKIGLKSPLTYEYSLLFSACLPLCIAINIQIFHVKIIKRFKLLFIWRFYK